MSMCTCACVCVVLGRCRALLSTSWDVGYGPVLCILGASEGLEETGEKLSLEWDRLSHTKL